MIKHLSPQCSDESLYERILPWTSVCWGRRWPTGKSGHIPRSRGHNRGGYEGLLEGFLRYSCRQDSTVSYMQQVYPAPPRGWVYVSPSITSRTEFLGGTPDRIVLPSMVIKILKYLNFTILYCSCIIVEWSVL